MIEKETIIVEEIIENLTDRSGFDGWWYGIDEDIQDEIKTEMEKTILDNL